MSLVELELDLPRASKYNTKLESDSSIIYEDLATSTAKL
jgi:hypothetical protein